MASMIRAAFALLAASALLACGTQAVKCQPSNCSGCCSAEGACLGSDTQSRQACGSMGADCRACLPDQLCGAGRCARNPDASVIFEDAGTGGGTGGGGGEDSGAPCGQQGQACCAGSQCFLALACDRGFCQPPQPDAGPCGAVGQACCANQTCTTTGATCSGGTCVAPQTDSGVTQRGTGEPCTADTQCLDGACLQVGFTGGYCTKGCAVATDCLAGSQCGTNPSLQGPSRICLKQCSSPGMAPGGCRTSYVCDANAGTSGVPVCFPGCTSNVTCGAAPTCDSRGFCCGAAGFACCEGTTCESGNACMSGTCRPTTACGNAGEACCTTGTACLGQTVCRSSTCQACGNAGQPCCASDVCSVGTCQSGTCTVATGSPFGGPCSTLADCQTNSCIASNGTLWPGGYCTQTCNESDSATCPSQASCSRYASSPNLLCLEHCAWDGGAGGCRTGYVCDRGTIAGSTQATCFTGCTSTTDCGGLQCQSGFCCGSVGFRCCTGNLCPQGGTCNAQGYCQ